MKYNIIKSGFVLGLTNIIISLVIYVLNPVIIVRWWMPISMLVVSIGLLCYLGIVYGRRQVDEFGFKVAFIFLYITLVISSGMNTLFSILLYTVIDPNLPQALVEAVILNTEELMKNSGYTPHAILEQSDIIRDKMADQFSIKGIGIAYLVSLLINAVISVFFSLIIRKKSKRS